MIIKNILEVGCQPTFVELENFVRNDSVFLKLEGLNLAGSIKLKTAKFILCEMIRTKAAIVGKSRIIESSSGNLGIALSMACKIYGFDFTCVVDPNIRPINEELIKIHGGKVIKVTEKDINGGYLGTRINLIKSMLNEDKDLIWTNQYANTNNVSAHYNLTAKEIEAEFPNLDYLFIGVGTGGTFTGCARYFKEHCPATKIIAVDALGSVSFGGEPQRRLIPGLGTSTKPQILECNLADDLIVVPELDTISACLELKERYALLLGGSSGTVAAAIKLYSNKIAKGSKIAAISPDMGHAYLDTIYNRIWVKEKYVA